MAEPIAKKFSVELEAIERAWIAQALALQRQSLIRGRMKEMAGGDIWTLRGKEIDALTALMQRF